MPFNKETKVGVIHVPRTGGTYLEHLLGIHQHRRDSGLGGRYNDTLDVDVLFGKGFQHLTYSQYVSLFGKDFINQFEWISIIRDPYERLLSVAGHTYKCTDIESSLTDFLKFWVKFCYYFLYNKLSLGFSVKPATCQHIVSQSEYLKGCEDPILLRFSDIGNFGDLLKKRGISVFNFPENKPNARRKSTKQSLKWLGLVNKTIVRMLYYRDYKLYE